MKKNKNNIGTSGEYFVAAELERRGFIASLTMKNTKSFDILAITEDGKKQYAIQVKTNSGNNRRWQLSSKNEKIDGKNIFYIFVCLNDEDNPKYYIVPSKVVAKRISLEHERWLNSSGKNNQRHKDNPIRIFTLDDDKHLDAWNLLKK